MKLMTGFLYVVSFAFAVNAYAQGANVVPGEYIVKFKQASTSVQIHSKINGKAQMKGSFANGQSFHIAFKPGQEMGLEELKMDPEVEYIEPNFIFTKVSDDQPGVIVQSVALQDIERQAVGAQTVGYYDQTGANVHATEAWAQSAAYSATNRPIVAVVDTGLDGAHYVFSQTSSVWVNSQEVPGNGVDDDFNGYVDDVRGWNFVSGNNNFYDDQGHGTHVAGIVLGATMDVLKSPPLAVSKIRIMPLKFLAANGNGSTANAVSAIYYAVNNGAKVINCSWGGSSYSRSLHEALAYAYAHGVLVVSAAGNYTNNNDHVDMYPANYDIPSNISIAATNDMDNLTSFSNFGTARVHMASPGSNVFSPIPGGNFGIMSGTSMAAPLVAGAAALAFREAPQLSGYQMRSLLMNSATRINQLTTKVMTGARVDVLDVLNEAQLQHYTAASQPNYVPQLKAERSTASSSEEDGKGGCGLIKSVQGGLPGGGTFSNFSWLAIFLVVPVMIWYSLRSMNPRSRRKHDRFRMSSGIKVMIGDRELTGQMNTISMGGLSFNVDEALEKGGIVSMRIASPDGKDVVEVQGQIVWT